MANLETIPGQRGYLVVASDGGVIQSAGDLQNDEKTGAFMLQMVKNSVKLVSALNSERKGSLQRLSVVYKNFTLVASVWNHKIHIVKRVNPDM